MGFSFMGMELPSLSEMGMQVYGNNMARRDYAITKQENREHDIRMFSSISHLLLFVR